MARLVVRCPSCEGEVRATRLSCAACDTQLEGKFDIPPLLHLNPGDLEFVTSFVRSGGSLKAMAQLLGVSYPTVRNRLDEIIAHLNAFDEGLEQKRHEILDALDSGKLTVAAAAEKLKKVGL